ncbi:MAG: PAS domain S-box protein [Krumholzibacteria bacterium]|nr:PAS domain S-box protein [Candidatus Krumholzibacteria bacterium]
MLDVTNTPRRLRRLLPWIFAVLGCLVVFALWTLGATTERRLVREDTALTADQVHLRLEAWVGSRVAAVRLFAGQHSARSHADFTYEQMAFRLIELFPGLQALNLLDQDGVIRDVVPEEGNEAALGRNVHDHIPGVGAAVDRAGVTRQIAFGPVITLFQGGLAVTSYAPVFNADGGLTGFINGVFRIDTLVDDCLSEGSLRQNYRFRLLDPDGREVYRHAADTDTDWPFAYATRLQLFEQPWSLVLAPSPQFLDDSVSYADEISAAVGIALVLLLAWLLRAHFAGLGRLADSQARYRLLVEHTGDMIVKMDPQGRFLYVSPSYCVVFGRSEEELLDGRFVPQVHEEDRAASAQETAKLALPPYTCYLEQRALTRDGWRWHSWSDTAILGPDGRIEAVIGVGRDISERKELEDQLRQAQKLQAVGQLAGGIAHDFNNILQAVLGNLHFAQEELPPEHPAAQDLQLVQKGAERAAQLTRQLLAFSRQQMLSRTLLDVNRLVSDHLRMLHRLIGEGLVLEFKPGADVGPVSADPGQLEQVLLNLCVNARDAIGAAGTILITTGERALDDATAAQVAAAPGSYVAISVADDGCGMDEAVMERIFDPFFTTKGVGHGTGLGLATAYGIVKQHGGFIDVVSARGQGSTFTVCLPRAEGEVEVEVLGTARAPERGHETILLAEDDEAVREFAERALTRAGYRVITARDGLEAVELATRHADEIGLALLDVVMPKMGGVQAAQRIRALAPGIGLVFASGYAPGEELPVAAPGGDVVFLGKPYRLDDLLRNVREILDRT